VTHIYLLIGCAFAPTFAFILVDGGFITNELCIVGLSGVLFLGVGDTTAALYGRTFGRSRWSKKSSKTSEGTWACIAAVSVAYYLMLAMHENPFFKGFFMVIAFATFLTSIIEGMTF
jgi:dolichol kinase